MIGITCDWYKKYSRESKKPWYSFLTGSTVTSKLGSESEGFARMTISEPSWFGKLIGKKSAVTIVPGADDKAALSDLDNKLVAKTAAEFMVGVHMTTTYPYQAEEMKAEYNKAKGINIAATPLPKAPQQEVSAANVVGIDQAVIQIQKAKLEAAMQVGDKRQRRASEPAPLVRR